MNTITLNKETKRLLHIYNEFGHITYGERMSVLSHSVQAYRSAIQSQVSESLIIAAFLHDVGHLIPLEQHEAFAEMGAFGIMNHEEIGANFLERLGFSPEVVVPISNHVKAKKYLCAVDDEYYELLSEASRQTLQYQGGPMSKSEQYEFESEEFFEDSIILRRFDDEAKEEDFMVDDQDLREILHRVDIYLN